MEYVTDLHVHTSGIASCPTATPEEMVECAISAGLTTVVLTNHVSKGALKKAGLSAAYDAGADEEESAQAWLAFCDKLKAEYDRAVAAAVGRLNVIYGAEFRDPITNSDFLIYGVTDEIMRDLEGIIKQKIKYASPRFREAGCLVYQAHPFRNGQTITSTDLLDGIEVCNFNIKVDSRNDIALLWEKMMGKKGVCGSDFHHPDSAMGGGIVTDEPITDNETLVRILRDGAFTVKRHYDPRSIWKDPFAEN